MTYHQPVLLTGGQVVVGEQPGGLQDARDALHVAGQREALMSQNQQLCGWGWGGTRSDRTVHSGCPVSRSASGRRALGPSGEGAHQALRSLAAAALALGQPPDGVSFLSVIAQGSLSSDSPHTVTALLRGYNSENRGSQLSTDGETPCTQTGAVPATPSPRSFSAAQWGVRA